MNSSKAFNGSKARLLLISTGDEIEARFRNSRYRATPCGQAEYVQTMPCLRLTHNIRPRHRAHHRARPQPMLHSYREDHVRPVRICRKTFSRAANVIREYIEVEGAIFLMPAPTHSAVLSGTVKGKNRIQPILNQLHQVLKTASRQAAIRTTKFKGQPLQHRRVETVGLGVLSFIYFQLIKIVSKIIS
jgi:hypothetical protein